MSRSSPSASRTRPTSVRSAPAARNLGGVEAFEQYDELTNDLLDGIDEQLSAAASDSRALAIANSVITVAALLAAVFLALLISRLLLNPIRRVREGALEVANERLPEMVARIRSGEDPGEIVPIDVTTHEEMGQLARAVDDLHRQAVHLASGEAKLRSQVGEMFTTLSRRNTSLINQQLGLIERLEKDEEDPNRLESLFRLDHLASRMRRTADSLMVLADASVADQRHRRPRARRRVPGGDGRCAGVPARPDRVLADREGQRRGRVRRRAPDDRARRQRAGVLAADRTGEDLHQEGRRQHHRRDQRRRPRHRAGRPRSPSTTTSARAAR